MPLYEFVCHDCTLRFERLMSFSQEENPVCPACQSLHTLRQVSMPSIHFRGSGFYQTDARAAEEKKDEADKDGKTDKADAQAPEGQKDTKAAKEDAKTKSTPKDKDKAAPPASTSSPDKPRARASD